jgi:hypothetical protein
VNQRASMTNSNAAANRILLTGPLSNAGTTLNPIGPNGEALVKASPMARLAPDNRNPTSRNRDKIHHTTTTAMNMT